MEIGLGNQAPEAEVFTNLQDANRALYVGSPLVCVEAVGDGSGLAASFGDASVEERRDLTGGAAVNPSVFPKEGAQAIPERRCCGREEERAFLAQELQVKALLGPPVAGVAEP